MTLIVANNHKQTIEILSDTKLTYPIDSVVAVKDNNYNEGTVKFKFITKHIVVAFAGDIRHASKAYQQLKGISKLNDVCTILLEIHKKSFDILLNLYLTDFIIAYNNKSNTELIAIKDGVIKGNQINTFIGDVDAYNAYLNLCSYGVSDNAPRINNNLPPGAEVSFELGIVCANNNNKNKINSEFFTKIIENDKYPTVGGLCIYTQSFNDTFKFVGGVYNSAPKTFYPLVNTPLTLNLGTASDGGFSINIFESMENCVAVHFPKVT